MKSEAALLGRDATSTIGRIEGTTESGRASLWDRLDALAEDVGRLRRRAEPDSWNAHVLDRVAGHIETLDAMTCFSAGALVKVGIPVDQALAAVDEHVARMQCLLAEPSR